MLYPSVPLADALAQQSGVFGAAADPILLTRLGVKPGVRLTIGNAAIEIRAALANEPDKLAGGIGFGPRLLVSQDALRATGLLQPGSLVHWHYRLRLPANDTTDAAAKAVTAQARVDFPEAGWDIRSRGNASPQLERNVERFTQFLTIVGLTALLVGGVGVGNAVKGHLDRRREVIATMKALGASGARVFAIYLTQVMLLACSAASSAWRSVRCCRSSSPGRSCRYSAAPRPALQPAALALAPTYGWRPRSRSRYCRSGARVSGRSAPSSATGLRRSRRWPRRLYVAFTRRSPVVALVALAVVAADDRRSR